ncbi:MAG: peptide ABC transporter substrate-binding protein, partial [Clostridia bacterium]|nr:peptide ABC transporter substrate-binding protein [Clostridia bacterium]
MKKLLALVLALVMALSCAAMASAEEGKTTINVCIASEPDTLDPALNSAVDGATMIAHLFTGLAAWEQDENG